MIAKMALLSTVVLLLPSVSLAQEVSVLAKAPTIEALAAQVQAIQQQIAALHRGQVPVVPPAKPPSLESIAADVAALKSVVAEQQVLLGQIAEGSGDGAVLALRHQFRKSSEFRNQMRDVVNESIRRDGTLRVTNYMATNQDLFVNGRLYTIAAGSFMELPVPVGTVSTRLPGQDLVNWTIGAPTYLQGIEISPRRASTWSQTYVLPTAPITYYP